MVSKFRIRKAAKARAGRGGERRARRAGQLQPPMSAAEASDPPEVLAGPNVAEPVLSATPFPVVGVGASAGGLGAFTALLTALPADTGMAFVLIQHMDPTHESFLTSLLQRATAMAVHEAALGMTVEPNHVYVIPPNKVMAISKGILVLTPRNHDALRNRPIDYFLHSLADDLGNGAIGIVLSGTGSDGTHGLRAIKAQGGITFAQDQESAQQPGMPLNAVAAGCVDLVLPPERIAAELARMKNHPYVRGVQAIEERQPQESDGGGVRRICTLLQTVTGVDFRLYKPATITRRIDRRMALRKIETLEEYAQLLMRDRKELNALYDDIFIHVTGFFRDPKSLDALQRTALTKILSGGGPAEVRIWVPGCSSGEEVYTIAMLLFEQLGTRHPQVGIQVFGTDICDKSIEQARSGIYADMSYVSRKRQGRFFSRVEGGFQIAKQLRDICVFARHDLAKDPPFSKLDLISCRNVLIYMGPALQKRVVEAFHYALRPGGYLLLGRAESLSSYSHLFAVEDSKYKIFSPRPFVSPVRPHVGVLASPEAAELPVSAAPAAPAFDSRREAERVLIERYAPAALVVDPGLRIIHFQGKTGPFLAPATGEPSFHLLKMVRPELIVDLRAAIRRAKKEGGEVRKEGIRIKRHGHSASVDIQVWPLKRHGAGELDFLVVFQETPTREPADAQTPALTRSQTRERAKAEIARRDRELASLREQLREMIQEHEAADEEALAMNEEILSSNEELQSTNEELETAKEEIQSTNEELTTLNDELQKRNAELSRLMDDLSNLLIGVNIPILFLDTGLRIRRFTPSAGKVFNLIDTDIGRPFSDIASTLDAANLGEMALQVIEQSQVVERETRERGGHWYTLRMRPYRTAEMKVEGVLVALLDIDAVKRSLDEARESRDFAEAIVATVREPLLVLDAELRVVRATRSFCETFEISREGVEGRNFFDLDGGQWNIPRLRTLLGEIVPRDSHFENFEVEHDFPSIGYRSMVLNARQVHQPSGGAPMILLAIEDVTDRRRSDQAILGAAREDERLGIARELHDDLVQRLASLAMDLGSDASDPPASPRLKKEFRSLQSRVVAAAEVGRRVAYKLHPLEVEDLGLEAAVRACCESFGEEGSAAIQFTSRNLPEGLKREVASCLYRVVQQSLHNVVQHANAKRATVMLEGTPNLIRLRVEDDGVGFSVSSHRSRGGLGILSMKERVRLAGGEFSITSAPGKGARVRVEVPLQETLR